MTPRTTAILGAVAVVVLGVGLVFGTGDREQQASVPTGQLAFAGLAQKLQDAARLEMIHHGTSVHLLRKGETWTVADADGYPARQDKVRGLITALTELKLLEPRTANPDDYARLGVEDATGKDAASTQVGVLDASGGAIAQIILGHQRTGSAGNNDAVYVRKPGEAQAWLADGQLAADDDAQHWLDTDIANIPAARIASIAVTHGDQTLTLARKGDKLELTAPADHPKLDPFKIEDMGRALQDLSFQHVKPAPPPGTEVGHVVFTTTDGMAVTVTVSKAGADIWAALQATGDGAAKAAAAALQARVAGWAYELEPYKSTALVPTLDDLKAYQPPPAPPAAASSAAAPAAKPPGAK